MPDPLNLSHLSGLLEKATPAPWRRERRTNNVGLYGPEGVVRRVGHRYLVLLTESSRAQACLDIDLLAALRNAAPYLINRTQDHEQLVARVPDSDVLAWAKRHDLNDSLVDLRCMFDDARSFRPEPSPTPPA